MTKERIETIRQSLIPFVKKELLEINYDGLGKSDAKKFEKDLNEILDLSIKALEQQSSDDCVSLIDVRTVLSNHHFDKDKDNFDLLIRNLVKEMEQLPPVTPTHGTCKDCTWWKSENRIVGYCNACKHGHCSGSWDIGIYRKTKNNFYCADFEKRGGENGIN